MNKNMNIKVKEARSSIPLTSYDLIGDRAERLKGIFTQKTKAKPFKYNK